MNIISRYFPNGFYKRRVNKITPIQEGDYMKKKPTHVNTLKQIEKKLDKLDALHDKYAEIIYEVHDLIGRENDAQLHFDSYYLDKD